MLQRLKDKLFWKTQFDFEWRSASAYFDYIEFHFSAHQKIKEKKYLWREGRGKRSHISPRLAAFKALEEFCEEYYRAHQGISMAERDFEEMGHALEYAAPFLDEDGNYIESQRNMSNRWKSFAAKRRKRWEQQTQTKKQQADEISSFRFSREDIDAAWKGLTLGQIPENAERVWKASYPRKSGHEIASKADVTMREFVFWMIVFREHLYFEERVVNGTHLYLRSRENSELSSVISEI